MSGKLGQLWKRFNGEKHAVNTGIVGRRFLSAFQEHGIEATQIPRIIPALRLDDLSTPEKLLGALTPEIIDQVASLFGIRSQWIEGVDDQIYDYLGTYKEPLELLGHISTLSYPPEERKFFPLRVLTTEKRLDRTQDTYQILVPVLVEPIAELGEETIYRYYVYRDGFDWNHYTSRLELKVIARVIFTRLHTPTPLFKITAREMEEVLEGRTIPRGLMRGALISNPSLEDYALSSKESSVAKETDELSDVLEYIGAHGLENFSFDGNELEESSIIDIEPPAPSGSLGSIPGPQKQRLAQSDQWEPLRHAAQAIWAQDSQLPIAEVARRLKRMRHLKASAYTENAIHKRITDLAPEGVRGKPGRKPKQSSPLMPGLIQQQLDK